MSLLEVRLQLGQRLFCLAELPSQGHLLLFELFVRNLKPAFDHCLFIQSELKLFTVLRAKFELRLLSHRLLGCSYSCLDLIFYPNGDSGKRLLKVLFEARSERLQLRQHSLDFSTNRREWIRQIRRQAFVILGHGSRSLHYFLNDGIASDVSSPRLRFKQKVTCLRATSN